MSKASPSAQTPSTLELFVAFVIISVITLFVRQVSPIALMSGYIGGVSGDSGLYVWLFNHHLQHLFSDPWFSTRAFYPYGETLAWSDNFILPALVAFPFVKAGISIPFSYNLIILGSLALAGIFSFVLAFRLCERFLPSLLSAIVFISFPFLIGHSGHPQLQFIFVFPLLGLGILEGFFGKSIRGGIICGLALTAGFYTSVYYSIFCAIIFLLAILLVVVFDTRKILSKSGLVFLLAAFIGSLPILAALPSYLSVKDVLGERGTYEAFYFAASSLSYFSAPFDSLVLSSTSSLSHPEAQLFLGLVILVSLLASVRILWKVPSTRTQLSLALLFFILGGVSSVASMKLDGAAREYFRLATALSQWLTILAAIWLLVKLKQVKDSYDAKLLAALLITAFILFALSFGPLSHPQRGLGAFSIYQLAYTLVPGVDAIRAIGRIGVALSFILSLTIPIAFRNSSRLFLLLLCLIPPFEALARAPLPIQFIPEPSSLFETAKREMITSDAMIVLPWVTEFDSKHQPAHWSEFANRQIGAMLGALDSGISLVNGYSGQRSKLMREMPYQTRNFPDAKSISALCSIAGLKMVLFDTQHLSADERSATQQKIADYHNEIKVLGSDALGNILVELKCALSPPLQLILPASQRTSALTFDCMNSNSEIATLAIAVAGTTEQISIPLGASTQSVALPKSPSSARPIRIGMLGKQPLQIRNVRIVTIPNGD